MVQPNALVKVSTAPWLIRTKLEQRLGDEEWSLRAGSN
ncbi:hypothetical protein DHODJN_25380 [Methylorubrum extorquens]|jgi:hypothetical protein